MRVAIVDDEVMERELLRVICAEVSPGIEFVADCGDGRQALQAIALNHPDLVFLDVQMPIMDGIQTARILREAWPHLNLVIVSAHDSFVYAQQAIELHVLSYLLKPVSPDDLRGVFQKNARLHTRDGQRRTQDPETSTLSHSLDTLTRVLEYIDDHLQDELSLNTLAGEAGFHPVHLSRIFKKEFGIGLAEYISKVRIQKAQAMLLRSPAMSIQDVALTVGFSTQQYFSAVFRNEVKCSPTEFREQHGTMLKNQNNRLINRK